MSDIVKKANEEIDLLEKLIKKVDTKLINVPEGSLKWQNVKGKTYYYHQYVLKEKNIKENIESKELNKSDIKEKNQKSKIQIDYIKKDSPLAKDLANKHYYNLLKLALTNNLKELKRFESKYQGDKLDNIYDSLPEERKKLVTPLQLSIKEQVRLWNEETYEPNNMYPENLRYETEQGEMVRSKSEVIIANILYKHRKDILYKYEKPLMIVVDGREKVIYPDFTIINIHTGKVTYWEHAGLMNDEFYATEFVRKMNNYVTNGLVIGKDVIVSYEAQGISLDIRVIKNLVKQIIQE